MAISFSELRSPQVGEAARRRAVLILPVGQIEEHGPHLPVNTDLLVARRVCEEAVARLGGDPEAYVLDPISYGYSQSALKRWPGTFVVPQDTVIETLAHIVTSLADMGFRKVVVVSTHGNHDGVVRVAARRIADERGIGVALFFPYAVVSEVMERHSKAGAGGSCHAGEMETSLMLHLAPELVEMSVAPAGDELRRVSPYPRAFVSTWAIQRSVSGALGDPTCATPELGKLLFERMVAATADFVRYYHKLEQV